MSNSRTVLLVSLASLLAGIFIGTHLSKPPAAEFKSAPEEKQKDGSIVVEKIVTKTIKVPFETKGGTVERLIQIEVMPQLPPNLPLPEPIKPIAIDVAIVRMDNGVSRVIVKADGEIVKSKDFINESIRFSPQKNESLTFFYGSGPGLVYERSWGSVKGAVGVVNGKFTIGAGFRW